MSFAQILDDLDARAKGKLERKLPSWAGLDIDVPASINLEQCSGESAARYKASLLPEGARVADLTGGLGVDSWAFAGRASAVWYNERDAVLVDAVRRNFAALGVDNVEFNGYDISVATDDWKMALRTFGPDVIYLDPARRSAAGRKVFLLEDCSPDVVSLMPQLLESAPAVLVKVSPMADLTMLQRRLAGYLSELHVVGADGECKELLCLCNKPADASKPGQQTIQPPGGKGQSRLDAPLPSVVIRLVEDGRSYSASTPQKVPGESSATLHPSHSLSESAGPSRSRGHGRPRFPQTPSASVPAESGLQERGYTVSGPLNQILRARNGIPERVGGSDSLLFVPSAAMVKSGLGPGMGLMEYDEHLAHFGKYWQVIENLPFASSVLKSLGTRWPQAEVTARGVPLSSEQLRAKIKTKPGGSVHIFACPIQGERRILVCKQMLAPE